MNILFSFDYFVKKNIYWNFSVGSFSSAKIKSMSTGSVDDKTYGG